MLSRTISLGYWHGVSPSFLKGEESASRRAIGPKEDPPIPRRTMWSYFPFTESAKSWISFSNKSLHRDIIGIKTLVPRMDLLQILWDAV
jgi:hypothetical protein